MLWYAFVKILTNDDIFLNNKIYNNNKPRKNYKYVFLFQKCFSLSVAIATIMTSKNFPNGKKSTEKNNKLTLGSKKLHFLSMNDI